MKKYILTIVLALTMGTALKAQFSIGYSVGYGTYSMSEMKELLDEFKFAFISPDGWGHTVFSHENAVVDNFPGYVNHQLEVAYRFKQHEFGAKVHYMTTGGKVSVADYSGEISSELTMNGFKEEIFYRYYLLQKPQKINYYLDIALGLVYNELKAKDKIVLYDVMNEKQTARFHGFNASITPAVGICYKLNTLITLRAAAGYEINFPDAKLKKDEMKASVGSNWSGLRLQAGVSFYL
ncbi:hypothetical protein LJC72_03270 [Bacteroides sp. OttesenSCG-928-D19]|nr:hypothetical protein [Bacteroides sp. OttesenSCG-928-D19]